MEIIRTKELEIQFKDIEQGECFTPIGSNLIYMKTMMGLNLKEEDVNAVELTLGIFKYFNPNCSVNKVKCQLIVE